MNATEVNPRSPVLDTTVVEELNAIDEAIVEDLVHAFSSDVPGRLSALRSGVAARSANDILREAQGLKSGACAVGAVGMAELCAGLENDARAGRFADAATRFERLLGEFDAVRAALALAVAAIGARVSTSSTRH